MYIGKRYLKGEQVDEQTLSARPVRSEKIEEIFRRVRRRAGE